MSKLLRKVLLAALALCLSLGIVTACSSGEPEPQPEPQTVVYTVNVTGDQGALSGVSVALMQSGTEKASQALQGGKAVFELPAGTYDVSLKGLSAEYTYSPVTLTENTPTATISVQKIVQPEKKVTYTVNVTCEDDILSGVSVVLSQDGVTKGTAALSDGKATFELPAGNYTVTLMGLPDGYTHERATVTADSPEVTIAVETSEPPVTTTTYTVNVVCEDDALPQGLNVQMLKGNSVVKTMPVENGKAVFELASETYTASLTGLPEGYTCEDATVTADSPNVTLTVKKTPEPPKTITYTVTVTGADGLSGLKVQMKKDGTVSDTKPVESGKAVFNLVPDTYTVSLTGLPEGYTCEDATATADSPNVTLNVQKTPEPPKTITYTVTVTGADGLSGLNVQMKKGDTVSDTKPVESGKAVFDLVPDTYTASLTGLPEGYTCEDATVTADSPNVTLTVKKTPEPPKTVTYTVTVTGADGLSGLNVQMKKDGTVSDTKPVESGKAVFELVPDTYTASLTGLPEGYTCEDATATADSPNVTLNVQKTPEPPKTVTYTITVTCEEGELPAGLSVELKKDGATADTKPVENGKAVFELVPDTYTVSLTGLSDDYTCESTTVTADSHDATLTVKKVAPPEPQTIHYTVTVECTGTTLPITVRVQLKKGDEVKGSQPLTAGKAEFELEPDTYTASLTGLPAGIEFVSEATATLTPDEPNATFRLKKKVEAVDVVLTVTNTANKDLFGRDYTPAAPAGMKVELYASPDALSATATGTTDAEGSYKFTALKLGTYYVKVNGTDAGTIEVGETTSTAAASISFVGGTVNAPLTFQIGENALPFTQEILEALGDESVYFTLTVETGGLYSFDADSKNANVSGDALELAGGLIGVEHIAVNLEADTLYTFACSSSGSPDTGFGYTVTITEGNTQGGGDTPTVPWDGKGTKDSPYIITELKGEYAVQLVYDNGFTPVYFKYTETKGAKYAIYSGDENFFLTAVHADDDPLEPTGPVNRYYGGGNAAADASLFETADGVEYLFVLSPYDDDLAETVTVKFTIGDFEGWTSKWAGSGRFQKAQPQYSVPGIDDPYIIETLVDTYDVMVNNAGVYFKYQATETKNYTIEATGDYTFSINLRDYNGGDPIKLQTYAVDKNAKAFTLNAGTTYLFYISANYSDPQSEIWSILLKFEIKEGEAVVDPEQPDGSEDHPYVLEPVLGDHDDVDATSAGVWYTFTATEDADYVFALKTQGWLVVNGTNLYSLSKTVTLTVKSGKSYTLCVKTYGGAATAKVSYSVTKKSTEPDGSKERPYILDTLLGDHSIPVEKTVYYKYTLAEDMTIVVTSKDAMILQIGSVSLIATGAGSSQEFELKAGEIVLKFSKTGTATKAEFTVEEKKVTGPDGTKENPFPLEGGLLGTHTVTVPSATNESVFYKVTVPEDMTVVFTAETQCKIQITSYSFVFMAAAAGSTRELTLTEGEIIIQLSRYLTLGPVNITFSVEKKAEGPDGSEENPFVLENLLGEQSLAVENSTVYYKYTLEADLTIVVTAKGPMSLTIGETSFVATEAGNKQTFDLKAGEIVLKFEKTGDATKAEFTVEEQKAAEPDGTKENPFPLDGEFLGKHNVKTPPTTGTSYYYKTTISEDMTVLITSGSAFMLYIDTSALMAAGAGVAKEYVLTKGDVIIRIARFFGGGDDAQFTIAKVVPLPEEFEGTWKSLDGVYEMTIDESGALTLKNNGEAVGAAVTSGTGAMEGGTFYYVTFGNKQYELKWDGVGKNALELYASTTGDVGEYIYFAPDPLPTFDLKEYAGEYVDRAGEKPNLVVSDSAITWQDHTVLLVGDVTENFSGYTKAWAAYVDSKPEIVLIQNGSFYFQHAQIYFDSAKEEVELPSTFVGKWKSLDGSYLLNITDTKTLTLTVDGAGKQFTLSSEKNGVDTLYYLTVDGTKWELAVSPAGLGTLMLVSDSETVYFTPDPIPTVTFSSEIGTYTLVDYDEGDPVDGEFTISANAITWTGHTVIVANVLQTYPELGTGYPLFIDGNPYQLMNYGGMLLLVDPLGGAMYTLEEGAPQPQDVTYTVTVKGADKDIFGNTLNEAVKADVSVSLMKGDRIVETKMTGTDGKVTFTQPKDSYTVQINGQSYDLTDNAANVTLFSDIVYGSEEHPLTLKTGLTQLPFTEDILDTYNGAYYTFTPAETGTYVFTVSAETVVLVLESEDDGGSLMLMGQLSGEVTLKEKIVYSVMIANQSASACTLNVEKKTEGEIEGSGTQSDPEILKSLNQTITRFAGIDANGRYYFRFTADKTAILTITAQTLCTVGGALVNNSNPGLTVGGTVSVPIQEGTVYDFWLQASQKGSATDVTIVLSTSDAPDIPWSGTGTKSSPYVLTEIGDEITVYIAAGGFIYFSYTTDTETLLQFTLLSNGCITLSGGPKWKTGGTSSLNSTTRMTDTVSASGTLKFYVEASGGAAGLVTFKIEKAVEKKDYTVTVKSADKDVYGNTINEAAKSGVDVSLMNGEQVVETKQTGADGTVTFSQPEGNYTVKINESTYTFTENAASVTLDSGVVYGTQDHPLELQLGANEFPFTLELLSSFGGAVYYTFTPTATGNYKFTASTSSVSFYRDTAFTGTVVLSGQTGTKEATLKLEANSAYIFAASSTGAEGWAYTVTVELDQSSVEVTPDTGFHFGEVLYEGSAYMIGTWKTADGYTMTITETTFLLTDPDGAKCSYKLTETEDRFDGYTYSLSWNGKTYTLSASRTAGPAGGLVLYEGDTAAYTFTLSASEEIEVTFPTEMQGTWKCRSIVSGEDEEEDEDVSSVPDLVIGVHTVTWGTKTVKILAESAGTYVLDIDGENFSLLANVSEFNTMVMLHNNTTDVTYIFANVGASGGETEDKVNYTVTVNLKDSDVFGNSLNSRLGAQVEVTLYNGEDVVETAFTNGNGVVTFTVVERDTYKVQIYGKDYDLSSKTITVDAVSDIVYGTQAHPLTLTLGANKIPLTLNVLSAVQGYVYYDLQVEVSGNYVLDIPANASVQCDQLGIRLLGSGAQQVEKELDAETVYHFKLSCSSPIGSDWTITLTIEAAQPAAPWAGKGTQDEPYIIEELIGEYNDIEVVYTGVEAEFVNVYFKYTPTEDVEYYTLTLTVPADAVITFIGARSPNGQTIPSVNAAQPANYSAAIKLTKGTDLIICVSGGNDTSQNEDNQTYETFKCSFKVESYELPEPETGSAQKPDTLTELLGTHSVTTETAYYYTYTATADGKYYVSTDYAEGITFTVRDDLTLDSYGVPTGKKLFDLSLNQGGKDVIELQNGKTYYFTVKSNLISEGAASETFSFTIETWTAGEPDGSKANPFPLEDVFKEHTFEAVPQAGFYYTFSLEEETVITVTALTKYFKIVISQSGKNLISKQVTETYSNTFTAQAGEVLICVTNMMEGTVDVKIKLEKVGGEEPTPPVTGGTKDNPEVMDPFTGTFTRNADYSNGWYITFTAKESAIYTITNQSTIAVYVRFGTASALGSANAINKNASKDFLANAGTEYIVVFSPQSTTAKVDFTMSVSSKPMPTYSWDGEGTESVPYVLTGDEDLEIYATSQKHLYFTYTFTYGGTITFTPNTNYRTRITLMGGLQWGSSGNLATDYYVYSGPASDASRTLTFEAGQTVTFALGLYTGTALAKVGVSIDIEDVPVIETATYSVTVNMSDLDVFGKSRNSHKAEGVEVSLYDGERLVETQQTDMNGKATFTAEKKDGYTVKIAEQVYPFEGENVNVTLFTEVVWGSDAEHPLPLTTGNNSFTFTKEIFTKYSIFYFALTAEEGSYGFTETSALLAFYKGNSAGDGDPFIGKTSAALSAKIALSAGVNALSAMPNIVPQESETYSFTLTVVKYVDYTVTIQTGETDVFGKEYTPAPIAAGTKITLLDGDSEIASGETDESGVVVLSAPEKTTYRIRIDGMEETFAVPLAETTVTVLTVLGTQGHPLTINAGETEVNVSSEYAELGIYYTFTPETDGVYTFSGTGDGVWFTVSGGFAEVTVGGRTQQPAADRELVKGNVYTVKAYSLTPGTAYTIKIELDLGTDEGEENNPIVIDDPFTTIEIKGITNKNRYYTFTLSENVTVNVTLVSGSDKYYVKFNALTEKPISSTATEVELEAGKVVMRVHSSNTLASDCSIKIEKKAETADLGTPDNPEDVEVLEGTWTKPATAKSTTAEGGYNIRFAPTETAYYTFSTTETMATVRFGTAETAFSSLTSRSVTVTGPTFMLCEAGTTYTIVLFAASSKTQTNFTVTKTAVPDFSDLSGNGTQAEPYVLTADRSIDIFETKSTTLYFRYVATEHVTLNFTALMKTKITIISGATAWDDGTKTSTAWSVTSKTSVTQRAITLSAGDTLDFSVATSSATATMPTHAGVSITIAAAGDEAAPDLGVIALPAGLPVFGSKH